MSINLVDANGNKTGEVSREQFIRDYIDAKRAKDVEKKEQPTQEQVQTESPSPRPAPARSSNVERRHTTNPTVNGLMNGIIKMLNEANLYYKQETMKNIIVYEEGKRYEIKITEKKK